MTNQAARSGGLRAFEVAVLNLQPVVVRWAKIGRLFP